jgi:hypothetical protein
VTAREKPPTQEQWKTGARTGAKNNGNNEKRGRDATLSKATEPGTALPRGNKKTADGAGAGDHSHKSQTRIYAIAELALKSKQGK